jgi:hypothetical protein
VPEIDFTIDAATGELRVHVKGLAGPACEDVATLARELLGEPGQERRTAEYHPRPVVRPRVRRRAE